MTVPTAAARNLCRTGRARNGLVIDGGSPSAEAFLAARDAAQKALKLDSTNAGAHNVLADVKKGYDWDIAGADAEYRRALQLSPSRLLTRSWYAEFLARVGKYKEAVAESVNVLGLDPVSPLSHNVRSMIFFRCRRFEEAIPAAQRALDLDPNFVNALWWQGMRTPAGGSSPKRLPVC